MRLTVDRAAVVTAVRAATAFAPRDAFGLRVAANSESLEFRADGPAAGVRVVVPASAVAVHSPGRFFTGLRAFANAVSSVAFRTVHLSASLAALSLTSDQLAETRQTVPAESPFTPFAGPPSSALRVDLPSRDLAALANRVVFAVARPARTPTPIHGVHLEVLPRAVRMTATDGVQMACAELEEAGPPGRHKHAIIPAHLLRRWPSAAGPRTVLTLWGEYVALESDRISAWSSTLPGPYPRIRDMADARRPHTVTLPVGEVLKRVRAALAVADRDEPMVSVLVEHGLFRLSAEGEGSSVSEWPVDYSGPPLRFVLPARRWVEYLRTLPTRSEVRLEMTDERSFVVFRDRNKVRGTYLLAPYLDAVGSRQSAVGS